jgi:hypothetical protein
MSLVTDRIRLPEGIDLVTWALITDADGNVLFSADVSTARVYCYDLDATNSKDPYFQATLTVGDVMEAGPTAATTGWKQNSEGYTFKATLSQDDAKFEGARNYRVEYKLDTTSDGMIPVVAFVTSVPLGSA